MSADDTPLATADASHEKEDTVTDMHEEDVYEEDNGGYEKGKEMDIRADQGEYDNIANGSRSKTEVLWGVIVSRRCFGKHLSFCTVYPLDNSINTAMTEMGVDSAISVNAMVAAHGKDKDDKQQERKKLQQLKFERSSEHWQGRDEEFPCRYRFVLFLPLVYQYALYLLSDTVSATPRQYAGTRFRDGI